MKRSEFDWTAPASVFARFKKAVVHSMHIKGHRTKLRGRYKKSQRKINTCAAAAGQTIDDISLLHAYVFIL